MKPTLTRHLLAALLCAAFIAEVQALPNTNFVLEISTPEKVFGEPGQTVRFEAVIRLVAAQDDVQGWSLSFTPLNTTAARVVEATVQRTVGASVNDFPPGLRETGFERTELSSTPAGGAVSAVVLSFVSPVTLAAAGVPYDLLRCTLETTIPADGSIAVHRLALVDGLRGVGQPVDNVLTVNGHLVQPTVLSRDVTVASGIPLDSTFTYQGHLRNSGTPLNGTCDLQFSLWDDPAETNDLSRIGGVQTIPNVAVSSGTFTVTLNEGGEFGNQPFNGIQTWLDVSVRSPAGSGQYTPLSPRQPIKPTPQAGFARSVPWSGIIGVSAGLAALNRDELLASLGCSQQNSVPSFNGFNWTCRVLPSLFADGHSLDAADGSPVNALYVDNAGRVGIGTPNPTNSLHVNGSASATSFFGNGSGLTGLDASQLTSGTVNNARLGANVARLDINQTYSSSLGISLKGDDRPLITRGWDAFTSGPYVGAGRWGLFMEPSHLTIGMAALGGRFVDVAKYKEDGSRTVLLSVDQSGNLVTTGVVNPPSDRAVKHNFEDVNAQAVLEQVARLPLRTWSYTNDTAGARHLGPVAQDFHAAFGLGTDDKHIATVDADGVALAAIQGLNQKLTEELKRRDAENAKLRRELQEIKRLLTRRASE